MISYKGKYRELARYVLAGFSVTLFGVAIYQCLILLQVDYRGANAVAIILCKLYAYVINKRFVFRTNCQSWEELIREMGRFFLSRGFTGVLDYVGLIILVEFLGVNKVDAKYGIQIVVIFANYVLGKSVVFRRRKEK